MDVSLTYDPIENFDLLLSALSQKDARAWNWLVTRFRDRLRPFLWKRTGSYPKNAILSREQFMEEVIEETLLQFFQIFQTGSFYDYSKLEATVVTIAGYKLKEGFARLRKEQRTYFMEADALSVLKEKQTTTTVTKEEVEAVYTIKKELNQLELAEKELLMRYFNGEELQDIAEDLNISAAACRKRKQRIVEKLRARVAKLFIFLALTPFLLIF